MNIFTKNQEKVNKNIKKKGRPRVRIRGNSNSYNTR